MKSILTLLFFSASAAWALETPTNLTAEWTPSRGIKLTWTDPPGNYEDAYIVQRRSGTTAWTNIANFATPGTSTVTYTDAAPPGSAFTVYFYRVRSRNPSLAAGTPPAEVVIAGIPANSASDDTDADGLLDSVETGAAFLDKAEWTDGTADHDGDHVPNAWEANLGTIASITDEDVYPAPHVLVDPTQPVAGNVVSTISAALTKLTNATNHPNNSCRIIRVKPGIYRENLVKVSTNVCNIAILPERTMIAGKPVVSERFEIQGTDPVDPVISVATGSLVIDGFVISRAAGTKGPILSATEEASPAGRISVVRMVNCMISNIDAGTQPVVVHPRGRMVLSHCTFYMNQVAQGTVAQSYGTGLISGTTGLESTARMRAQNCIFWNPVNTFVPELQSAGVANYQTCIAYRSSVVGMPENPSGCFHVNPGLNPQGYIATVNSPAVAGGTANLGVMKDVHGEDRLDPPGRGADDWYDGDGDGIPAFADTAPTSNANAIEDNDTDGLSDLVEYLSGTSVYGADSPYLTIHQAYMLFLPHMESASTAGYFTRGETYSIFYTKTESHSNFFSKTQADERFFRRSETLRVSPSGDIGMGEFTTGTVP